MPETPDRPPRTPATPRPGAWSEDTCPDALRDALRQPVDLGPEARARLATALAAEPRPRAAPLYAAARWLVRPVRRPLPPLAMGAAAAALLLVGVLAGERRARATGAARVADTVAAAAPATAVAARGAGAVQVVRFVLVAPAAAHVSLVGDFNAWDAERTPMRASGGDGVWTVEVPVSAGRHVYAFVVDGTRWIADPAAPLAPEDGFGSRNSVLVVGAET
jgi:hypothetical protein